jgi:hypothetical protein
MIKPTITNAFTLGSASISAGRPVAKRKGEGNRMRGGIDSAASSDNPANQPAMGVMLSPMQCDLREADFGFSLELSPIQAVDAVHALLRSCSLESAQFLVSMEQSAWTDGNAPAKLAVILERLGITPLETISPEQAVLDGASLASLAALTLPARLLVMAVDGPIEVRDARAINHAIENGVSPLTVEMRLVAALEVLGDRSVVLHTRQVRVALNLVAQNFRHYLAAITDRPAESFAAPELGQVAGLLEVSGALTVRPIETSVQGESIDIGVSTAVERFTKPANMSLIYDRPSNSWHAE